MRASERQGLLMSLVVATTFGCAAFGCATSSGELTSPVRGPTVHIAPASAPSEPSPREATNPPECDISGDWEGSGDDDVTSWAWLAKLEQRGHLVRGEFHWSTGEGEAAVETVEGYVRCDRSSFALDGVSIESDWDGLFIPGDYRGTFDSLSIQGRWSVGQPGRFWGTRSSRVTPDE